MEVALWIAAAVALSLAYALHGILLLRWCGLWTQNRRLILWVSQMLFPYLTGAFGVAFGAALSEAAFGTPRLGWPVTIVDGFVFASWILPSLALATAAFLGGPALALRGRWLVWGSGAVGVATAWLGAAFALVLFGNDNEALWSALVSWHAGALGVPLAFAWRVRTKRKRALGGRACLDCGYDLTGVTMDRCPECGAKRWVRHEGTEARRHEGG